MVSKHRLRYHHVMKIGEYGGTSSRFLYNASLVFRLASDVLVKSSFSRCASAGRNIPSRASPLPPLLSSFVHSASSSPDSARRPTASPPKEARTSDTPS